MVVGFGKDSHAFDINSNNELILGGIIFKSTSPLKGNSDADVVLHALTNAISSVTGVNILGSIADELCLEKGIKDSRVYLKKALEYLGNQKIVHVAISIECAEPKISPQIDAMKTSISNLLNLNKKSIGITATSGEGLTAFGRGEGILCECIITVKK